MLSSCDTVDVTEAGACVSDGDDGGGLNSMSAF